MPSGMLMIFEDAWLIMFTYGQSIVRCPANIRMCGLPEAAYEHLPASRPFLGVTTPAVLECMWTLPVIVHTYIYARMYIISASGFIWTALAIVLPCCSSLKVHIYTRSMNLTCLWSSLFALSASSGDTTLASRGPLSAIDISTCHKRMLSGASVS